MPNSKTKDEHLPYLSNCLLMDIDVNINYERDAQNEDTTLFLEAILSQPKKLEAEDAGSVGHFYVCTFRCGRRPKDATEEIQLISVEYGFFTRSETEDRDFIEDGKRISILSVWPRFLSLASVISAQMMMKLPEFPPTIDDDMFSVLPIGQGV